MEAFGAKAETEAVSRNQHHHTCEDNRLLFRRWLHMELQQSVQRSVLSDATRWLIWAALLPLRESDDALLHEVIRVALE